MNYSEMITRGISPILMKTEVDYKVPVTIHDHFRIIHILIDKNSTQVFKPFNKDDIAHNPHCINIEIELSIDIKELSVMHTTEGKLVVDTEIEVNGYDIFIY
jgi:hypothetical protein